jgi:hypothetical protein
MERNTYARNIIDYKYGYYISLLMEHRGLISYSQGLSKNFYPEPNQILKLASISLRFALTLSSYLHIFLYDVGLPVPLFWIHTNFYNNSNNYVSRKNVVDNTRAHIHTQVTRKVFKRF